MCVSCCRFRMEKDINNESVNKRMEMRRRRKREETISFLRLIDR